MKEARAWRWAGLAVIGALAALFASFNAGERVALNLGFATLYRVPLVTLIFFAFLAGMTTMFLLGLRHDLRVRRALREAGFGEPVAVEEAAPRWGDDDGDDPPRLPAAEPAHDSPPGPGIPESEKTEPLPPGAVTDPPPRYAP
jgi:uncharacterized integral membrane protein